jgi:hypothetical protein
VSQVAIFVILVRVVLLATLVVGIRDRRRRDLRRRLNDDDWAPYPDRCQARHPRSRERCIRWADHSGPHSGAGWRARRWH